jgi:hypothetical protein
MQRRTYIASDGSAVVVDNRSLADAQAERIEALKAERDALLDQGITFGGKPVQIDAASTANMNAAASLHLAGIFPAGFRWRMADNSFLTVTGPQMVALAATAAARVYAVRAAYWAAADAVRAATTRKAADAVTATWPA